MIHRRIEALVQERLSHLSAVALLGPRQVGKTTLARGIAATRDSIYLDLESSRDREKLSDPAFYLSGHEDRLVILDEVQQMPGLFSELRGLSTRGGRAAKDPGHSCCSAPPRSICSVNQRRSPDELLILNWRP